jgi:hypothetical protein
LGRIGAEAQAIVQAVVGKAHRVSFAAGYVPGPSSIATDHPVVIYIELHKLGYEAWNTVHLSLGAAIINQDVFFPSK